MVFLLADLFVKITVLFEHDFEIVAEQLIAGYFVIDSFAKKQFELDQTKVADISYVKNNYPMTYITVIHHMCHLP